MGTRSNILANTSVRDDFLDGVLALDDAGSGIMASEAYQFLQNNFPNVNMAGIEQELSYYDLFALWHVVAMSVRDSVGRNAAHRGPMFLPWHRTFMILLEEWIGIVTGNSDFGLPYWDWAADGELAEGQQWRTVLWTDDYLGESRNAVFSGRVGDMRVRLWQDDVGTLWSVNPRRIERDAGRDSDPSNRSLPTQSDVTIAMNENAYDVFPYTTSSSGGHRNRLEGWIAVPQLHNLVHVWIGGDMSPGTSPNDPAFFLNHCNVDRIWEAWMANNGRVYAPLAGEGFPMQEVDDAMLTLFGETRTPAQVLDPSPWYDYDSLTVD